jgi:cytidylate kinase
VLVDGEDVTCQLRTQEVDRNVSAVSANPAVRRALSAQQRRVGEQYGSGRAEQSGIIMVGRDIGTVIMPDAPLKIYMDASVAERARRRYDEQIARGKQVDLSQIMDDMVRRDKLDSERAASPLRPAADALVIDTSALAVEEVVMAILRAVAQRAQDR